MEEALLHDLRSLNFTKIVILGPLGPKPCTGRFIMKLANLLDCRTVGMTGG